MKIGILKETKIPVDNRVALTPIQIKDLQMRFPEAFKVQTSDIRAFSDNEYKALGIEVSDNVDDCDLLLGIKEADLKTILPDKHYIFFGHIAKKQRYNIPLFKTLIDNRCTFSDYEYLVNDNGIRLVAFGWFAGIVGTYYTLMGWGRRTGRYMLPMPHIHFSMEELLDNIRKADLGTIKVIVTGNGRVSQGAQHVLEQIGAYRVETGEFICGNLPEGVVYCVAPLDELVQPVRADKKFDREDFRKNPGNYRQNFTRFAHTADILLCCHFWGENDPVYLDRNSYLDPDFNIKMIGDITCDIQGSIKSTLRSSTHADPFYDFNPHTGKEEPAFSSDSNISVMAVDTCPNALPREASEYFGEVFLRHVLNDLLAKDSDRSEILDRATILRNGALTPEFSYLTDYVASFRQTIDRLKK